MKTQFTEAFANKIYDILIEECGALESERQDFVSNEVAEEIREYRFAGKICGGKFRRNMDYMYVDGYQECYNPKVEGMIVKANERITKLMEAEDLIVNEKHPLHGKAVQLWL